MSYITELKKKKLQIANENDAENLCNYFNSIKFELSDLQREIWEDEIKMIEKRYLIK